MSLSLSTGAKPLGWVMSRNPVIVDRLTTLDEALSLLQCYGIRHLPVVDCSKVVGMVSDRDLRSATGLLTAEHRLLDSHGRRLPGPERVEEVMQQPVHCLTERSTLVDGMRCMLAHGISAVPVIEHEDLIGIVTETDVVRAFAELHGEAGSDAPASAHLAPLERVRPNAKLEEALRRLDPRTRHLGVEEAGELVGILSDRDLTAGLARNGIRIARNAANGRRPFVPQTVRDVMTTQVITVTPETPLWRCAGRMLDHGISALPVLAEGATQGLLTRRAILEHFVALATRPDEGS